MKTRKIKSYEQILQQFMKLCGMNLFTLTNCFKKPLSLPYCLCKKQLVSHGGNNVEKKVLSKIIIQLHELELRIIFVRLRRYWWIDDELFLRNCWPTKAVHILFPAIIRNSHHRKSPTLRDQGLN